MNEKTLITCSLQNYYSIYTHKKLDIVLRKKLLDYFWILKCQWYLLGSETHSNENLFMNQNQHFYLFFYALYIQLNILCMKDKIHEYRQDWLHHIQHMPHKQLPRAAIHYPAHGKRPREAQKEMTWSRSQNRPMA